MDYKYIRNWRHQVWLDPVPGSPVGESDRIIGSVGNDRQELLMVAATMALETKREVRLGFHAFTGRVGFYHDYVIDGAGDVPHGTTPAAAVERVLAVEDSAWNRASRQERQGRMTREQVRAMAALLEVADVVWPPRDN